MNVVARHRQQPLVQLDDGSVIDTENLEVIGNGDVSGPDWEMNPTMDMDPRWEEISRADSTNLGVTERKVDGPRVFRAPTHVREALTGASIDSPLADGQGLTLDEIAELCERDEVTGPAEEWMFGILNKHEDDPDVEEEAALFSSAEPELDLDEIDSAMDDQSLVAAIDPPPGDFSKVVYLALIEEDDQKSVQDLVALVSTSAGAAGAFTFGDRGWIENPEVLTKLQAPAPPPIKQLEDFQTESIIAQIQSTGELSDEAKAEPWEETDPNATHAQPETTEAPVQASAFHVDESGIIWGPDNQTILAIVAARAPQWTGNAQRLRNYWQTGKGGAKIRWNTPGDWTRCRRKLSKYLGPRAAGYCQLMHHRMTGMWTGDRAHRALHAAGEFMEFAESDDNKKKSGKKEERTYNRFPKGSGRHGGQFAPGKARDDNARKAQDSPGARDLYHKAMSTRQGDLRSFMAGLSDEDLKKLTGVLYSSRTSDPDVVARRLAVAAEMAKRGFDVKDFGARGGGINSDKGKDDDSFEANDRNDPNRNKPGYKQAEDGSWVPDSFYTGGKDPNANKPGFVQAEDGSWVPKDFYQGKPSSNNQEGAVVKPGNKLDWAPGYSQDVYDIVSSKSRIDHNGVDVSQLSQAELDKLFAAGWKGHAGDNREAVYPPGAWG